jgi:hypothetical protein
MADEVAVGLSYFSVGEILQPSTQPYRYPQLKGHNMTRLLELQPAKDQDSDEPAGRLIDAYLHDGPAYETISYTWGDPVFDVTQRLPDGYLMITENLAAALGRFRPTHPPSPRRL